MSTFTGGFLLPKQAASGTPPAGKMGLGFDADGNPYVIDEDGNIYILVRPAVAAIVLTPAAVVTASLFTAGSGNQYFHISPGAGSGSFVARYNLPDTGANEGDIAEGNIDLPASANPTVTFYDNAGTEIAAVTTPDASAVSNFYLRFRFTGGAWICVARMQNI